MKRKKLKVIKDGQHIQTITFQKDSRGWRATHFNAEQYMPTMLHKPMEQIKQDLINDGCTWEWLT